MRWEVANRATPVKTSLPGEYQSTGERRSCGAFCLGNSQSRSVQSHGSSQPSDIFPERFQLNSDLHYALMTFITL